MYQDRAKSVDPVVEDVPGFFREFFPPECVSIIDVYCDPPFNGWMDMAENNELPLNYYFSMGCHPHQAKQYDDKVENIILEATKHEYPPSAFLTLNSSKCVAWGEIGLDYHYNHSPPTVQQSVLIRQLKHAVSLKKNIISPYRL